VLAVIASARLSQRTSYAVYFVGDGASYDVAESDGLQRLALMLAVIGYWAYIVVAMAVAVALGVSSYRASFKCLPHTWPLTALVSISTRPADYSPVYYLTHQRYLRELTGRDSTTVHPLQG